MSGAGLREALHRFEVKLAQSQHLAGARFGIDQPVPGHAVPGVPRQYHVQVAKHPLMYLFRRWRPDRSGVQPRVVWAEV